MTAIALIASIAMFALGVLSVPFVIARLPTDYFVRSNGGPDGGPPGFRRTLLKSVRNVLGALVLFAGIAMLVLPGQGVLTILLGLSLVDFPGKRTLLLRIVRLPGVRRVVAAIRRSAHKPPLDLDLEKGEAATEH